MSSIFEEMMRPASVAQIGGFRPSEDPSASWAGRVLLARAGEGWPSTVGEPMLAVAQLNLTEAPVIPPCLEGLQMLTLFIGPHDLPDDEPNGSNWELRAYDRLDDLVALDEPAPARAGDPKARKGEQRYKALPIRWQRVEDHPSHDDVPPERLDELDALEEEGQEPPGPAEGLKLGGWPFCIQSEVHWGGLDGVEFAVQIDGEPFGLAVGYGGLLYIGRRRVGGEDTWHADWQSM